MAIENSFDPPSITDEGSWAAVQSLVAVLRAKGALDDSDLDRIRRSMGERADVFASRGETNIAAGVRTAAAKIATVTDEAD